VRGILAPLAAFHLVREISVEALGWISAGLIVLSCLLLVPEIKLGRLGRPAKALVEEVSE